MNKQLPLFQNLRATILTTCLILILPEVVEPEKHVLYEPAC